MRFEQGILAVVVGLLVSSPVLADDASRLATAREIVIVTHSADNMKAVMPQIMNMVRPMLLGRGADPATVDTLLKDGESRIASQTGQLVELFANIYAAEFTEDDLGGLLAFDKSPAGQHFIEKQPELTRGSIAIGQRWGQMIAKQVLDDYARRKAAPSTLTP